LNKKKIKRENETKKKSLKGKEQKSSYGLFKMDVMTRDVNGYP